MINEILMSSLLVITGYNTAVRSRFVRLPATLNSISLVNSSGNVKFQNPGIALTLFPGRIFICDIQKKNRSDLMLAVDLRKLVA